MKKCIKELMMKLGKNRAARVVAAVGVATMLVCIVILFGTGKPYKSVSVSAAMRMMERGGNVLVVDVRTAEEYEDGHIPGAVNVPIADLREGKLDGLPGRDTTLLIYCYAGRRSKEAAEILKKAGYRNAYEFGGIVDWTGDIEKDGKIIKAGEDTADADSYNVT